MRKAMALGFAAMVTCAPNRASGMLIVINPDATLSANAPALAAFDRAGQAWSAHFTNDITINISAGLSSSFSDPTVIGNTSAVKFAMGYDQFRGYLLASAAKDPNNAIVASTPDNAHFTATLPAGISLNTIQGQTQRIFLTTKANYKALNLPINLDATYGANDATITFNSNFKFDYDNSNGVDADKIDFQSVATHELGHALGFLSAVDSVDILKHNGQSSTSLDLSPLDLFRFRDNTAGQDPSSLAEFTNDPRYLDTGGNAILDDLSLERALSTGRYTGDGLEASHWKDDALSGQYLGIMDPSMNLGATETITANDIRALDLIGYDVAIPEPTGLAAMLSVIMVLLHRGRRSN